MSEVLAKAMLGVESGTRFSYCFGAFIFFAFFTSFLRWPRCCPFFSFLSWASWALVMWARFVHQYHIPLLPFVLRANERLFAVWTFCCMCRNSMIYNNGQFSFIVGFCFVEQIHQNVFSKTSYSLALRQCWLTKRLHFIFLLKYQMKSRYKCDIWPAWSSFQCL